MASAVRLQRQLIDRADFRTMCCTVFEEPPLLGLQRGVHLSERVVLELVFVF